MEKIDLKNIKFVDTSDNKVTFRDKVRRLADDLGISFKMFYADGAILTYEKSDDKKNVKLIDDAIINYGDNID